MTIPSRSNFKFNSPYTLEFKVNLLFVYLNEVKFISNLSIRIKIRILLFP